MTPWVSNILGGTDHTGQNKYRRAETNNAAAATKSRPEQAALQWETAQKTVAENLAEPWVSEPEMSGRAAETEPHTRITRGEQKPAARLAARRPNTDERLK
jgi:hypothetical protein